jgi:hypothetical protein
LKHVPNRGSRGAGRRAGKFSERESSVKIKILHFTETAPARSGGFDNVDLGSDVGACGHGPCQLPFALAGSRLIRNLAADESLIRS